MRKVICLVLSIVMALSAVPVFAADNVVKLTGERIAIDEDTLSTVWEDQTGGTLVWDKEAGTLTFNSFHYNIAKLDGNYGTAFSIRPACNIILNGTSVITASAKVINTMGFNDAVIGGDGKLTVYGPTLEPEDTEKFFPVSWNAYSSAIEGSFTLNSGTLEGIGGTMKCDSKADLFDFANCSSSYGVYCNGADTIQINGGHLIAKGGTTSGRKYYNLSFGAFTGWGDNNSGLVIAGGRVTASGKDYGASGKCSFPQYSEGVLYAVGEKSGVGYETIDGEVFTYGSPELYADEDSVTGELSRGCTSIRLSDDDSSTNVADFYEYTTGGAPAKTVVVWRNNERKVAIADSGAELSGVADSTASLALVTKNIKAEEEPQIEWTKDTPGGISAAFADETLTFTSDGTTNRGVYPFKLAFGEGEKRVVSNESVLTVGAYVAKLICKNKIDAYFGTFDEAIQAAVLPENAGCRVLLFKAVSVEGDITLDGDFTLDLNGYDVTCSELILQNGAGVFGKGNIPVGKIGAGGKVGGGTYGILSTTDGKIICDHLIEDTFCIQKDDTDNNDKNVYWYDIAAVQSMANAVVRPISFKTDPVADVEAKAGEEIKVPINFHETPYYEKSAYNIDGFILINEDGSETKLAYGWLSDNFTKLDKTTESWERYPVKDKTTTATLKYNMFPGTGAYKVCAVLSAYLGEKEVEYNGIIYNLSAEKYVTKTEPFEIRIGVSRPTCVVPEDSVDADGNVGIGWNIYSLYTYTGAPQQLVHSTPQVLGGTMMYRFNENEEWSEEVPTATEPGVYTYQCYIKGNDGYMDAPMRDGRAVINAAVLADDKDDKYFIEFSDALAEAQKEENEGKLLKLYYADKSGFALSGGRVTLGLESAATVGDISLGGTAQLEIKYGTAEKINLSDSAQLNVSGGTVKNLAASGKNARINGGIFENITVSDGLVADLLADGYALQGSDGKIVNMYTNKISQTVNVVSHTHDLGDIGTCACGYEAKATDSDNDGFVEISTIEQLQWFANQTNTGNVLNAVLANDIDLSGREVMIGTAKNPFKGVFDGKGKTISNYTLAVSDNKQGLFGVVRGGTVKSFKISGTITIAGSYTHIGGAVGNAKGGAVISDIVSCVNISGDSAAKHVGGVVGSSEGLSGALTVSKCLYSGTIDLPHVSDCLGGVMGYANDLVTLSYCGFTGRVTGQADGHVGGVLGYINNANFGGLENSFSAGQTNRAALIGTVRACSDSIKNCFYSVGATPFGGSGASNHHAESVSEWKTGRAAYLLNGGLYDNTYIWRQTLGEDDFPNFRGDVVYRNGKDSFTSEKPSAFLFFDGDILTAEQVERSCVLIAASYGGDGRLIDVKMKDISGNTAITLDEMNLNRQEASRICAMLWLDRETMTPLCRAAEYETVQKQK